MKCTFCGTESNLIKHSRRNKKDGNYYQQYQCRDCRQKRYWSAARALQYQPPDLTKEYAKKAQLNNDRIMAKHA